VDGKVRAHGRDAVGRIGGVINEPPESRDGLPDTIDSLIQSKRVRRTSPAKDSEIIT
jgi:hypothetical protein